MASQHTFGTAAQLDATAIAIGTFGIVQDAAGADTGEVRLGMGDYALGGFTINGVAGGVAGVTSINGKTGVAVIDLDDLPSVTLPATLIDGMFLRRAGGVWTASLFDLNDMVSVDTTGALDGYVLTYDSTLRQFIPREAASSGGGTAGDNLGNHIATRALNMSGETIHTLGQLDFRNSWEIKNPNASAIHITRDDVPILALTNAGGAAGTGSFVLRDYATSRAYDNTTTAITNIAYLAPSGALQKGDLGAIPISSLAEMDHTVAPATGQVPIWNGTSYVPGDATSVNGGLIPTIAYLGGLTNVDLAGVTPDGNHLVFNSVSGNWEDQAPFDEMFASLVDVSATSPTVGQAWVYDGATWGPDDVAATSLGGLTDVSVAGPLQDGDAMTYFSDTSTWGPRRALLTDFEVTAPSAGDMMYFTGTVWSSIAAGANGTTLTMVAGTPTWS